MKFLNLNELELSERKPEEFACRGFHTGRPRTLFRGVLSLRRNTRRSEDRNERRERTTTHALFLHCETERRSTVKTGFEARAKNVKLPYEKLYRKQLDKMVGRGRFELPTNWLKAVPEITEVNSISPLTTLADFYTRRKSLIFQRCQIWL